MFTATLFTTAMIWTQVKFFHRGRNKDEVHIYSGILLSHKIEQNNAICNNMNGPAAAAKSLQSCLTLCDATDGSLPGSSVRGIFQARVLEWGAVAFSV